MADSAESVASVPGPFVSVGVHLELSLPVKGATGDAWESLEAFLMWLKSSRRVDARKRIWMKLTYPARASILSAVLSFPVSAITLKTGITCPRFCIPTSHISLCINNTQVDCV